MQPGFLRGSFPAHAALKSSGQNTSQPQQQSASKIQAEAAEAAKRHKKRKLEARHPSLEKTLLSVPESLAITRLNEHQLVLDDLLKRRLAEVKEAISSQEHSQKKKLRFYVFSTCTESCSKAEPAAESAPSASGGDASWVLYMYGRLMDAESSSANPAPTAPPHVPPSHTSKHPMTHYLRKVAVQKISQGTSGPQCYVWEKSRAAAHKEMLEIRGRGPVPLDVCISLEVDWQPERFTLSASLSNLLGLQYETKTRVMQAFWVYVKQNKLQDSYDPTMLNLNSELETMFGTRTIQLSHVGTKLDSFCERMQPIVIKHTIKVAPTPAPEDVQIHDIDVDVLTFQPGDKVSTLVDQITNNTELEAVDQELNRLTKSLAEHKRRRTFFQGFAQSPVAFINSLIASQARDLRVAKNGRELEAERRSDVFQQPWVQEAVLKYMHRKIGSGR